MKNKYLLSLLAALGFSGCGNNNEIWDEPCYYGPGPVWTPDIIISSQVQNEEKETINGIRVVSSYMNQEDSLITDTAYTESREIEHYTVSGIAINTFKFKEYPPKDTEMYLEYTDVDGEKNGAYQTKRLEYKTLEKREKSLYLKRRKRRRKRRLRMKRIIPLTPRRWLALEIFRRMKHERVEEHPLRQLFWECTLRCNVRCRHCGSDCKSSPATPDMPLQDFLKVLDSIATHTNPHDVFVIISGGEPTVREDLETCGKEISRRGYPWGMVCNGLCLTRERLHNLIRSGMRSISISLDGLKDVHNWMRRHPESFDCAVNAIREITAIPELTFDVITCVTRRSLPQLPAMKELLISLGVKRWRVSTIFPVGRAAEEPEFRMNGEELKQVLDFIRDTRKEGIIRASYGCEGFLGNYEGEVRNTPFFCSAGISVGSVLIDGSISACSSIRSNYHQGNIYQDDFGKYGKRNSSLIATVHG